MLVNVVVPHIPAAIIFRGYAPGVVTAVLINLPVLTFLSVRAIKDGYVSGRKAVAFAVGVPLGIVAAFAGAVCFGAMAVWFCQRRRRCRVTSQVNGVAKRAATLTTARFHRLKQ